MGRGRDWDTRGMIGAHDTSEPRRKAVMFCQFLDTRSMREGALKRPERTNTTPFCCSGAQMLLGAQSACFKGLKAVGSTDIHLAVECFVR